MRSGNGRHRRPRQAPALVVAAGVTGSAMALPLLATGSASAADAQTWDRVAECESGGAWSANFGNGLYGGLQFTQEGWEKHGGLAYAPSADLASRSQQIVVADKAFAAGDTQWATCAPIAGLKKDGKTPGVDPGPGVTPKESTGPRPESNRTDGLPTTGATEGGDAQGLFRGVTQTPASPSPSASSSTPASPSATVTPTAPGTSTTPGMPVTPGTPDVSETLPGTPGVTDATGAGKHRGDAATDETGNSDTARESGRHAAPSDGVAGDATGGGSAAGAAEGSVTADKTDKADEYTVKPGDSLSDIAQDNGLHGGWAALYDANKETVGADPDLILPGQSLELGLGASDSQG
ncbi:transglycosylase family protein [Streptomyces sp. NPDC048623]|uniref:transglycosylase family protein n=1 Tax=Streptomyces sp. NPDC048623 TaxID=3155761 RepID=UPI003428AB95